MAQKTVVQLVDDLDGSMATETVRFAVDGASYEIDLNRSNAKALRDSLADFTVAGRRVSDQPRRQARVGTRGQEQLDALRAWARANGYEVADRGRISQRVQDAYPAAQ